MSKPSDRFTRAVERGLCECGCGLPAPVATDNDYKRGRVKGQPMRFIVHHNISLRITTLKDVLSRVEQVTESGCWIWMGCIGNGYGQVQIAGKHWKVHRYLYEQLVGPIPEGLEPDHTCRVTSCCNPYHIEPVTHQENVRRRWAARTHCNYGHLVNGQPGRCQLCQTEQDAQRWLRRKEKLKQS